MKLFRNFSFGLMLACAAVSTGAHCGNPVVVATVATVKTIDEGIDTFTKWAVKEESAIADAAIKKCDGKVGDDFAGCVQADIAPKRAKIDKVKTAMKAYEAALTAAQGAKTADVIMTAKALTESLALCGINLGGA